MENSKEDKNTPEIKEKIEKIKKEAEKKQEGKIGKEEKKPETKEQPKQEEKREEKKDNRDQKIAELTDSLQRMHAEMQNFKKRCDKENQEFKNYVSADMTGKLLPILDSFELALKNKANHEEFAKGIEMIFGQFYDTLEKEGLRPIKSIGEKFDPYKHEVLLTEPTDKDSEDELIVEELQKGFMFKDRVLRYAKVKIKKKS